MVSASYFNWRKSSIGRGRKIDTREARRTVRIVVEGEKTEKIYFNEIRKLADLTAMEVKVIQCTKGTSATQIVEEGIQLLKQQDPRIDEVWRVFDKESNYQYKNFKRAMKDLRSRINSLSNPRARDTARRTGPLLRIGFGPALRAPLVSRPAPIYPLPPA